MPTAFQVFAVDRFPAARRFQTEDQLSLLGDDPHNIEVVNTLVSRNRDISDLHLHELRAEHDFLFQLQYPGRARGKEFREFITPYKFPLYLSDGAGAAGFRAMLAQTKKKVAVDFVKRLNTKVPDFGARPTKVDFVPLRPRLDLIRGAWFGAMQTPNLASTGVFGHHVDQSEEFQHAERLGELMNLLVEVNVAGVNHLVMVTADGGIILYNPYQTDDEAVAVASETLETVLVGCIAPK
jgi:hypothetical protein